MTTTAWILSLGFAVLMLIGVPFVFAIGLSVIAVLVVADIPAVLLPQTVAAGAQSFSLLAIPFFMLAAGLMSVSGLSRRLVNFAEVLVRHLPGGLGLVTILAALIFAAISGSAPATTAAIGGIMIPAMIARGYDKGYATALSVSAGVLAPLIPPSIAFVIWGVISEQSISKLFLAGVVPGWVMAVSMALIVLWRSRTDGVPRLPRASLAEVREAFNNGKWALLTRLLSLAPGKTPLMAKPWRWSTRPLARKSVVSPMLALPTWTAPWLQRRAALKPGATCRHSSVPKPCAALPR